MKRVLASVLLRTVSETVRVANSSFMLWKVGLFMPESIIARRMDCAVGGTCDTGQKNIRPGYVLTLLEPSERNGHPCLAEAGGSVSPPGTLDGSVVNLCRPQHAARDHGKDRQSL